MKERYPNYQRNTISNFVVGVFASLILFACILTSFYSNLPLEFIFALPAKLGIVRQVQPDEMITIEVPGQHAVELNRSGPYFIVTDRPLLLSRPVQLLSANNNEVIFEESVIELTDQPELFETWTVLYSFKIPKPGNYHLIVQGDRTIEQWILLPDLRSRNFVATILFYFLPVMLFFGLRQVASMRQAAKYKIQPIPQAQKRADWDKFIEP